jgi:hypothetical protein
MNELEILKANAADILERCKGWKKCQDGSYEMALHYAGYDDLIKQIEEYQNERTN